MTAPVLMVQGTASSVGKSVVAAGLCRILRRRGLRVAPFKAQNMSLNAAVTLDSGEIARSVAVQAAAAGVEPTVDMNPILLKPEAGLRSQVIVRGRVWASLAAREYFARKLELWPVVAESLDRLRAQYDVVVAEGAGSPAELNLRDHDIVNMRVARHAGAAVVLIGDVDRGGIFAQLIGTLDLLRPEERALVAGLVVNRFRGDPALFSTGVHILEERTGLPVFGVVPWVPDLGLPEEDSAALDDPRAVPAPDRRSVRIAVVRLPRIANFDDFAPLQRMEGVGVEYVDRPERLADADLVVLPGSKSTVADLRFLRARGLADALVAAHARGTPVLGICGGYQMLGLTLLDPDGVESEPGTEAGLGLLPHQTVFVREKRTCRVRARLVAPRGPFAAAAGDDVEGYEIHVGRSDGPADATPLLRVTPRAGVAVDEPDGLVAPDGLVCGTYLHGLFENESVRRSLVNWLRARRGDLSPVRGPAMPGAGGGTPDATTDPHERWADVLETALDIPLLLARCGVGRPGTRP